MRLHSLIIMVCRFIPVTDMDKVQTILEGRCLECAEQLPMHTVRCPLNPASQISAGVARIQKSIDDKLAYVTRLLQENQITVEEFENFLENRLGKDE